LNGGVFGHVDGLGRVLANISSDIRFSGSVGTEVAGQVGCGVSFNIVLGCNISNNLSGKVGIS